MGLLIVLLFSFFFVSPIHAVRSLPPGAQPESIEGEAKGTIPELRGSGTLTFINTGGAARLVTVCDPVTDTSANSVTCTGIDVTGTFTGGPDGTAVFTTSGGEVILQLNDGKVFSYSAQGITMNFMVSDPSIFDAWKENTGARDSGARVRDLSGQVEIACPPDLEAWDVMKMGRVIYVDCHLKTGEDSSAVISFSDMTTFEMKPETELIINTPPEKESKISLLAGTIWANVKQMVKDGTMKVHMSQAVAGIKGTRFRLTENGTVSKIEVTEGAVVFQSKVNGNEVTVSAGESVTATGTGLSDKTMFVMSDNPPGSKSSTANNSYPTMIYVTGGIVAGIMMIAGIMFLKNKTKSSDKKHTNSMI